MAFRAIVPFAMGERSDQPGIDFPTSRDADDGDRRAVAETLGGNPDAFRLIVERYDGLVYRLAKSYLGSREEAEEATQEIFLRIFRFLHSYRLDKAFLPWLYTVSSNHLRTRYVKMRRREKLIVSGNGGMHQGDVPRGDGEDNPAAIAERSEAKEALVQAMASLPSGIQDVITLYYMEGMSVSQISATLAIGTENVKSRLHRGRMKLRGILDHRATGTPESG
jgi:RNA polymerase sigma-70 factor (ECF subfamily)